MTSYKDKMDFEIRRKSPKPGARDLSLGGVRAMAEPSNGVSKNSKIEGLNLEIVKFLQEDGRATFSSIAEKLGVSESTVRARVAKMKDENVIHFITVTNPLALGPSTWAMLGISIHHKESPSRAGEYFRDLNEVVYAMRVTGKYDLLVEIVVESPISLRNFLDEHCYGSSMVSSVEPMIGLGLYKSLYKWEIPPHEH
tara:strand:- start:1068 stop:1658 length:591 start_codon:yes stop_codon:yes gene_type:complete